VTPQPNQSWSIPISRQQLDALRANERFHTILNLARIVNTIRFCLVTAHHSRDDETPSGHRQMLNSFFFLSAVLYEASVRFAETVGRHFRTCSACAEYSQSLALNRALLNRLDPIRNSAVFHFDSAVMPEALHDIDWQTHKFACGLGPEAGNVYYELADAAALHFVVRRGDDTRDYERFARDVLLPTTEAAIKFAKAADHLIAEVVRSLGVRVELVST
jgi:hypothetical protein